MGIAGRGVTDVGVEGVGVVGGLQGAIGAADRPERAAHPRALRGRPGERVPVREAAAGACRRGRCVRAEPVEREARRVGEHRHAADRGGVEAGTRATSAGHAWQRRVEREPERDRREDEERASCPARSGERQRPTRGSQGPTLGRSERKRCEHREADDLDDAGNDARRRPNLPEAEEGRVKGDQIAAQCRKQEARTGRRGDPPSRHKDRDGETERADHLEQEEVADRRDRPIARDVEVEVHAAGREQQYRPECSHPRPHRNCHATIPR